MKELVCTRRPAEDGVDAGGEHAKKNELVCTGLDGTDPVTVLAALGLLGLLEQREPDVCLAWRQADGWRPVLNTRSTEDQVVEYIVEAMVGNEGACLRMQVDQADQRIGQLEQEIDALQQTVDATAAKSEKRAFRARLVELKSALAACRAERKRLEQATTEACTKGVLVRHPIVGEAKHLDNVEAGGLTAAGFRRVWQEHRTWYLPGLACDVDLVSKQKTIIARTAFSFANNNSGKQLLKDFAALAALVTQARAREAVFGPGREEYPITGLGWDPASQRSYALQARDPQKDVRCRPVHHALAFMGLGFLPVVPLGRDRATVGVCAWSSSEAHAKEEEEEGEAQEGSGRLTEYWSWPLWTVPLVPPLVRSVLAIPYIHQPDPPVHMLRAMGIQEVRRSRRFAANKRSYFSPSLPVA